MEAKLIRARAVAAGGRCGRCLRRAAASSGRWGLIVALLALPVFYGIHDLTLGLSRRSPTATRSPRTISPTSGNNLVQGISNGAIWALIAIGYTLVYGIIELINFAHGDVFMIGSFTGAGLLGVDRARPGHRAARAGARACC